MLKKISLLVVFCICFIIRSQAQNIAAWDFTGLNTVTTATATVFDANLVSASGANNVTRGAGATASAGANSFRTVGFQNNGIATTNTDYFQVTLSPIVGYKMSLSTIDARLTGTASYCASPGVSNQFAYSVDGVNFTLIASPQITVGANVTIPQISLSGITALQNIQAGTTVTLRYYASGQTSTGGWGFYSNTAGNYGLAIGGSVTIASTTPTITLGTLAPFTTCLNEAAIESTTISGMNLTGTKVDIGPLSNYAFATSLAGPYTNSISLTYAGTTLSSTPIFIKYTPTIATNTTYNIPVVGGGVSTILPSLAIGYGLPTVTASANNSTFCEGDNVVLNGGGANSYTWNNGVIDGIAFPASTAFTSYIVTGSDANGCSSTSSISIIVNTLPTITANASNNAVCSGNAVTLTGQGANLYSWNNGVTDNVSFIPLTTQTYMVTGSDANGCSNTATINIVVDTLPQVGAIASFATICQGEQTSLNGTGANTYTWTDGTNSITNGVNFTPTVTATYTVTGTDAHNCIGTSSTTINIQTLPTINATVTASPICSGNTTNLNATGGISYTWSNMVNGANQTVAPTASTTYTVTGFDGACYNTDTVSVSVNPLSNALAIITTNNSNNQIDGSIINYTNTNCDLIATINDGFGGNFLDNTTSNVTITPSIGIYNNQPYVRRWYEITPTNNGQAIVTLYLTQNDFDDYNANCGIFPQLPTSGNNSDPNIANVRITQVSGGALGIGTPTVITPTMYWNGNYWEATFTVSSFSQFYFHSANPFNAALPANIISFSGQKHNHSNILSWITAQENNVSHYNVLYSQNGKQFTALQKIKSKALNGNSNEMVNYSCEHTTPQLGHNYYQLQTVDIDGKINTETKTIDIQWSNEGSVATVFPNPTSKNITLQFYTPKQKNATLKVIDISGRIVLEIPQHFTEGDNTLVLPTEKLVQGIYSLQIAESNSVIHTIKITKAN